MIHRNASFKKQGWQATRQRWIRNNPPDEDGLYTCSFCLGKMPLESMTLDHIVRRVDCKDLKHMPSNLRPMHERCNSRIGQFIVNPRLVQKALYEADDYERENIVRIIKETDRAYKFWGEIINK